MKDPTGTEIYVAKATLLYSKNKDSIYTSLVVFRGLSHASKSNKRTMRTWIRPLCHALAVTDDNKNRQVIFNIFTLVMNRLDLMPDIKKEFAQYIGKGEKAHEANPNFRRFLIRKNKETWFEFSTH